MCDKLMKSAKNHARAFQLSVEMEIARLPQHVRDMNLGDFIDKYNGEVRKPEQSHTLEIQREIGKHAFEMGTICIYICLDTWAKTTPKLRHRAPLGDCTNLLLTESRGGLTCLIPAF